MDKKGTFSDMRLGVGKDYIFPARRSKMIIAGVIVVAVVLAAYVFDTKVFDIGFTSPGAVSSNHAIFESKCELCHDPFASVTNSVTNNKCAVCHENSLSELGIYSFAGHYLYRSGDPARVEKALAEYGSREKPCAHCHEEHQGRNARISVIGDHECAACHEHDAFVGAHPEFEFVRSSIPDDSTMKFTHVHHTKLVVQRNEKLGRDASLEGACQYCHRPEADGQHFAPIEFDAHCGECHLAGADATKKFAVKDPGDPTKVGVETLAMLIAARKPGTLWALNTNPNEFKMIGPKISKKPIYHEDPWIVENLRMIRRHLYPDQGLSDLLKTSVEDFAGTGELYAEAIRTLQSYSEGLRGRPEPEVQTDLETIDSLIVAVRNAAAAGTLDRAAFATGPMAATVSDEMKSDLFDLADKLAQACLVCHYVEDGMIRRVRADQRVFTRGEFDHRAHLVQTGCLDCHTGIPITTAMTQQEALSQAIDGSFIQNVPGIDNCTQCHAPRKADDSCATCHFMHPNKSGQNEELVRSSGR